MSVAEEEFALQVRAAGLPEPIREHRFAPPRRWRFDFAWLDIVTCGVVWTPTAVEVEGGHWTGGRHTRGAGFEADCRKYAAALRLGWRVLRVTPGMIRSGEALEAVAELLGHRLEPKKARKHPKKVGTGL